MVILQRRRRPGHLSFANDDITYQDGGNSYVRGYSGGAQKRWLEAELARTRANRDIDWIVVVMHQVVISTADHPGNGADLGIRQEWLPASVQRHHLRRPGRGERQEDPGLRRRGRALVGGRTTMAVTYCAVTGPYGQAEPVDAFTPERARGDG